MSQSPSGDSKVGIGLVSVTSCPSGKVWIEAHNGTSDTVDVNILNTRERAQVLRKLDWHLLPVVSLLYFLSFLDRSNIANAKVAGMAADLNLVGLRYNTAAAVFFLPYCFGQVPSNIILKIFRPSRWIPIIMVAWGLVMTLMCLVETYQGLLVARVFLGLAESGLFPGVTYYLSLWYPRAERGKRLAIFFSAATAAGAFGGVLAYAIKKMEGIGGLHGWQWIFCLEGIVTLLVALPGFFIMYDYPDTASFLTETEKCTLIELLKTDSQNLAAHYRFRFVLQALTDYKTYLQFGIYISLLVPGNAYHIVYVDYHQRAWFLCCECPTSLRPSVRRRLCLHHSFRHHFG
ncbi:major facilitator superfamily domain-containing protein [Chiua virens]|nr:major facilitator superfamily domain-containing protein [Chiua virens]